MVVSTYQPYFAPFPGFFSKAKGSDILVLMDSVQFPRGTGWLNRNRFKNDQGTLWLTVPVWKKGLGFQKINEVKICNEGKWHEKHFKSLKTAYKNAPFFEDHLDFLVEIFSRKFERLLSLNLKILRYLMGYLDISTTIMLLSELGIEEKEPRLSVAVCEELKATHYLTQRKSMKHNDGNMFGEAGIEIMFFNYRPPIYPQLWGPFISNLSTFDLVFNCGPKAGNILCV
jgi:hypothetical protein